MIGAFLNTLGILLGGLAGLTWRDPMPAQAQNFTKSALGALTAFGGLQLVWLNVGGSVPMALKQLLLAALALVLGNWLGKLIGLQKFSNRLGRHAAALLNAAKKILPTRRPTASWPQPFYSAPPRSV